jgi:hypothetical protein
MLIRRRPFNVAAKSGSHFRKGLEAFLSPSQKLIADTRNPESFETSEPFKEIEYEDDCGCGDAALQHSCVRFNVNCRLILQKEHDDWNRGGNLPAAD